MGPGACDRGQRLWLKGLLLIDAATKIPLPAKVAPKQTARAVRVHVLFTLFTCALATAYRKLGEQDTLGDESGGWQQWGRPLPG